MMNRRMTTLGAATAAILLITGCTAQTDPPPEGEGPTTIHLVRHGEVLFNVKDLVSGWSDSYLTERGEAQADAAGAALADADFEAVLASDLGRTMTTAERILDVAGSSVEVTPVPQLREHHTGSFDGSPGVDLYPAIMERMGYAYDPSLTVDNQLWQNPGVVAWAAEIDPADLFDEIAALDETGAAEDWRRYNARLDEALELIEAAAREHPGGEVLVVSHGGTIGALLRSIDPEAVGERIGNASISTLIYDDDEFTVDAIGVAPEEF